MNVGVNVGVNNELAEIEMKILDEIMKNPQITALDISSIIVKARKQLKDI